MAFDEQGNWKMCASIIIMRPRRLRENLCHVHMGSKIFFFFFLLQSIKFNQEQTTTTAVIHDEKMRPKNAALSRKKKERFFLLIAIPSIFSSFLLKTTLIATVIRVKFALMLNFKNRILHLNTWKWLVFFFFLQNVFVFRIKCITTTTTTKTLSRSIYLVRESRQHKADKKWEKDEEEAILSLSTLLFGMMMGATAASSE